MKKSVAIILFIVIIFLNGHCFGFDDTNLNFDDLYNLSADDDIQSCYDFLTSDFMSYSLKYSGYYYLLQTGSNVMSFISCGTPLFYSYTNPFAQFSLIFDSTNFYRLNNSYTYYQKFDFTQGSTNVRVIDSTYTSGSNVISYRTSAFNTNIKFSSADILDTSDNSVFFAKNVSINNQSSEDSVDMTETNNILLTNFGLIKGFLFLICLYLLCKAIYGCIWWLYNKTLL